MIHPIDRHRAIERFEAVPHLALGHYPTPVEKLPRLKAALGCSQRLYIKREDYAGAGLGGNKVRKLEYIFSEVLRDGADVVITCGGLRSNHCRATAMLAAKLGLGCVLVMNEPAHPYAATPASYAINEWVGARIVRVAERQERAPTMERIADELRAAGRKPAIIPLGASTPLGALGQVSAMQELAGQLAELRFGFDAVFCSTSSGGTQAGLLAGKALFLDAETEVYGVSADDPRSSIQETVSGILQGIGERLGLPLDESIHVDDSQVGGGYGIETEAGREALQLLARTEGILLDPVYTAKAMAGMMAAIRRGTLAAEARVLFWHTGGQMALFYT